MTGLKPPYPSVVSVLLTDGRFLQFNFGRNEPPYSYSISYATPETQRLDRRHYNRNRPLGWEPVEPGTLMVTSPGTLCSEVVSHLEVGPDGWEAVYFGSTIVTSIEAWDVLADTKFDAWAEFTHNNHPVITEW